MTASIEIFIRCLGNPGHYQLLVFILLACNFFPIAFNNFVMTFYVAEPDFHCKMPQGWAWHSNASIPIITANGISKFDKCHMYKDPENHALGNKDCIYGYNYKLTPPEWPIVVEWNLVCNNKYLINVAILLYYGGCLFGALTSGPLAEKYGRKNVMLCCLMSQLILGFSTFFVKHFFVFVALRSVQGMFIQGLECVTIVLALELFPPKYRTIAGSACFLVYGFAMMFLSLLSYCIQHWRYIQLSISLPSIIAISYFWLVPESLRYLMVNQHLQQVATVLKKYEWFMPTSIPANANTNAKAACKYIKIETALSYDVRDLMKSAILRRHTLFHCFCWLSAFLMYYSLSLFIPDLNSNRYINFFLIGLVEFLSHLAAFAAFHRFGRRRPLFILFICSGVLSITSVLVDHLAKSRLSTLKFSVSLAVIGKMCITACVSGLYIFSVETFPTIIRTVGIGLCASTKISGALLAPLIQLLGHQTLKAIPIILVGAVALVAAFVVLMLPETHSKSLPDLIPECEDLGKHKSISPMVDKRSSTSGKVTLYEHPLTPPIKRATLSAKAEENEKIDEGTVKIDIETHEKVDEDEKEVDEVVKDDEKVINNRCVRFLGIEVLENVDKSVNGDERRVRFSNVVHNIDNIVKEDETNDSTDANDEKTVVDDENMLDVKPAFSILKKTNQNESDKKIVSSPHPIRKITPPEIERIAETDGDTHVNDRIAEIETQENEKIAETDCEIYENVKIADIEIHENERIAETESEPHLETKVTERKEIENEVLSRRKESVYENKCV